MLSRDRAAVIIMYSAPHNGTIRRIHQALVSFFCCWLGQHGFIAIRYPYYYFVLSLSLPLLMASVNYMYLKRLHIMLAVFRKRRRGTKHFYALFKESYCTCTAKRPDDDRVCVFDCVTRRKRWPESKLIFYRISLRFSGFY